MRRNRIPAVALALFLAVLAGLPAHADKAEGLALIEAIGSAKLDTAAAVEVAKVELDMGLGRLAIVEGWLYPAEPVGGRVFEAVFVGDARFEIEPPDEIERGQLELFTEQESLERPIKRAVLVLGGAAASSTLLDRATGEPTDEARTAEAVEAFDAWVSGPHRRGFGADAAILKAALGDEAYQSYFAALMHTENLGDFQYVFDPSEQEQITLGQFVPAELDDREQHKVERSLRKAKRRGRSIQTRLADLGNWNTWIQTSARDANGDAAPGSPGFEPERYTIDVELDPKEGRLAGKVRIDAAAYEDGRRVATLDLYEDLVPQTILDGEGNELAWFRSGDDLHVVLAGSPAAGSKLQLDVEYEGVAFGEIEPGVFPLQDTYAWYPRVGAIDRATYRVTLRYPKKFELLASGVPVEESLEGGTRIETRSLDVPVSAFTFEIGDFEVREEQVGHVKLKIGFGKTSLGYDANAKTDVVETLKEALAYYEETFGAYPLDHLTVATVPRGFSQGFLSCITLSHFVLKHWWIPSESDGTDPRQEQRRETVAHELAHQWWGNKVGWESYRDQWLSEALADYSAVAFVSSRAGSRPVYLARHATQWKNKLGRMARKGRVVESLGPVVLGRRLSSSLSDAAYSAIVYDKGSVVFAMLARMLGSEQFNEMLKALADNVRNRAISTETFLKSIEHMSGYSLESFAGQFVFGTGIPEVYYTYEFTQGNEGKWTISGLARQVSDANYRYTLDRTETGGWDVSRERLPNVDISEHAFVAPFQVVLTDSAENDPSGKKGRTRSRYKTGMGLGGNMLIRGEESEFSFEIARQPRDFFIDQNGEVLAYFYCESREPKKMLRFRAMELEGDEAEAMYRKALSAPLYPEAVRGTLDVSDRKVEQRAQYEDAVIHLYLSRLYLDQGRDADAEAALETANSLFKGDYKTRSPRTRERLRSRLEMRRGEFDGPWRRLSPKLRLNFPLMHDDTTTDRLRRNKWRTGRRRRGNGEDYAMLAALAFEIGKEAVARQAMKEAERRGAQMAGPPRRGRHHDFPFERSFLSSGEIRPISSA